MKGKPLLYPAAARSRYQRDMSRLICAMVADYEKVFSRLHEDFDGVTMDASLASQTRIWLNRLKRKWDKIFNSKAAEMADKFTSQVDMNAQRSLNDSLKQLSGGITIKTPAMPEALKDKMIAATAENVSLIKSIPQQFHSRIEGAALRSVSRIGSGSKTLLDEIRDIGGVTEKRAAFIAVDQTRKITTAANYERMKSAGIRKAVWHHSAGSAEPRELHLRLDGEVFDLDNPPVIDEKTGERGLPGQLPNCKCFWTPVIDFGEET
ncbi:phage minor head protein [Morganella morganii]|jgi:SPP1 gp7 family putative phage head morphogenesis protein|nr:phage minor head protein [Morganella morganii]KJY02630.1 Phage Mu protein F like protein [Morganella morganii]STZ17896.1 phage head morphogenesis protein, SPP1 gp7 family [Morganella morganii]